jgi:hypothetical protein
LEGSVTLYPMSKSSSLLVRITIPNIAVITRSLDEVVSMLEDDDGEGTQLAALAAGDVVTLLSGTRLELAPTGAARTAKVTLVKHRHDYADGDVCSICDAAK